MIGNYKEFLAYIISGVISVAITLFVYYILVFSILDTNDKIELQIANIISWFCAVIFVYFTNHKYVFYSTKNNIMKEFSIFIISRIATLILDMGIMFLFVSLLHYDDNIIKLISQFFVIITNYLVSKFLIFK